ncbi:MAG: DUF4870 domain-containing protein [Bacillota bacterium]
MEQEEREGRTWGIFCHLGALSLYIGVPFGNILVPLIIWLIKKDELPLVDEHGKQSLNFQISITVYAVLAAVGYVVLLMALFVVTGDTAPGLFLVLLPLLFAVFFIVHLAFTIIASIRASNGEIYRYPLAIRFFK